MKNFLSSFSNKKFKYGTFSTLTAIFVIGILLVINLVASQLNFSFDLTTDKRYSLSDESKTFLAKITDDVTIYPLFRTGDTDGYTDLFKELLDEYSANSNKIKLEYKDPYIYPQFVQKYAKADEQISPGSIIVESAKRFKVIPMDKLVSQEMNYETFETYVKSVDIEPQVTNAIKYVTDEKTNVIYRVTNHNELQLPAEFQSQISTANYEIKDLDLLMTESIPEDCSMLLVTTPERDWAPDEAEKVMQYLQSDGRAAFFIDYVGHKLDNLKSVLSSYGVEISEGIIFEGDNSHLYRSNPIYLIPDFVAHDITQKLIDKNTKVLVPGGIGIKEMALKKNTLKFEPLIVTSNSAFSKVNPDGKSISKEVGDLDGPFTLAAAVTDSIFTKEQHYTKIIVAGASSIFADEPNAVTGGTNINFLLNCINWTQDKADSIYVVPKTAQSTQLTMDYSQSLATMVFSAVVLPGAIFLTGFVVWLRRRNS